MGARVQPGEHAKKNRRALCFEKIIGARCAPHASRVGVEPSAPRLPPLGPSLLGPKLGVTKRASAGPPASSVSNPGAPASGLRALTARARVRGGQQGYGLSTGARRERRWARARRRMGWAVRGPAPGVGELLGPARLFLHVHVLHRSVSASMAMPRLPFPVEPTACPHALVSHP